MLAHRLNDNELTFQYPAKTLLFTEHRCFFFFFSKYSSFVSVERREKASLFITRRTISRTPRNNALFETGRSCYFFLSFFTTRLPSPPTQLIHPPHFLAHLRCNRPIFNDPLRKRCKNGEASNGEVKKWRMAKEREEERREAGLRNFHVINQPRSSGAFSFELVSSRIPSSLLNNREAVLRLL